MTKVALLFPGQGSQYIGMGKKLCEDYQVAAQTFDEANDILGFDLKKICFEGKMEELTKTDITQPALLTASVASFRVYMEEIGVTPQFSAGHSVGEYAALTCSGAISFADSLKIVRKRGLLMQEASEKALGKMVAVRGLSIEAVEKVCKILSTTDMPVVVACYNSLKQNVIAGHSKAVEQAVNQLEQLGGTLIPLKVSAAFHSPMMQTSADELRYELDRVFYDSPKWEVISNVSGLPYTDNLNMIDSLTEQMVKPVRWNETMMYLQQQGVGKYIELGPKAVLSNLLKDNDRNVKTYLVEDKLDVTELLQDFDLEGRLAIMTKCLATAVCIKNRNWDSVAYHQGVIEPYQKVNQLYEALRQEQVKPTDEQLYLAFDMLSSVVRTKKVPIEQQKELFKRIVEETGALSILHGLEESEWVSEEELIL
ncbi:ACP S-malonyltransferase [Halalkalibacter urbisdiaboli]|uniref:ACP S-malonyltransferase n=1 Tax=Halalkalibacter urbisdiaboli TaxID=1960589 RepID=UPI000B430787|nr:ACP S-malonyltransferase [Halalkalibacter urbisdiaboli]